MQSIPQTAVLLAFLWGTAASPHANSEPVRPIYAPGNAMEQAAFDAAAGRVEAPDRFSIDSVRLQSSLVATDVDPESIDVIEVDGPNRSGVVRVSLRVRTRTGELRDVRSTVRGRVFGRALVATRTLLHKRPLTPADLEIIEVDLTRLPEPPLRQESDVDGRVPTRTLSSGRVLHAALFEPEPLVRRGEIVQLLYETESIRLTLKATALTDAASGQRVEARIESSGVRVSGTLTEDGLIQVRHRVQ